MNNTRRGPSPPARSLFLSLVLLLLAAASPAWTAPLVGASLDLAVLPADQRERALARLSAAGVSAVRLPLEWSRVEPASEQFTWTADDTAVQTARAAGLEVTLVLGPAAPWAVDPALGLSPDVARFSIPRTPALWERYVRAAAEHYRGQVRFWQVRELPNVRNFRGSASEYLALLASAARVLRAVDPENRVIQPEPVALDPAGLDRRLRPPAGQTWDIWGSYLPSRPDLSSAALPLSVMAGEVLAAFAVDRPLWIVGAEAPLPPDRWAQYYLLAAAFDVARVYAPEETFTLPWGILLTGLNYDGFLRLGPHLWALAFHDASGPVIAAWSDADLRLPAADLAPVLDDAALATSAVVGSAPGSAIDVAGPAPVLLLGPRPALLRGLDVTGVHARIPTRRDVLPDRGMPSLHDLPAVSVDYSRLDRPEQGLYNRRLRGLPGGRVCEQPHLDRLALGTCLGFGPIETTPDDPWIYFDVDDSWLYFARGRVPMLVTVEVAAPAAERQVGFSLYYDAVEGYRSTPWQWVDPGSGWHRVQVLLPDASFTNRNGYDFRINAKGSRQDLWVASVTVEKRPAEGPPAPVPPPQASLPPG